MTRYRTLTALVLLASCNQVPFSVAPWDLESGTMEEDVLRRDQISAEIAGLVGRPGCRSAADCAALPLGAPCVSWYIVYSTLDTEPAALAERAAVYNWLDEFIRSKWGPAPSCRDPPQPTLACTGGVCTGD